MGDRVSYPCFLCFELSARGRGVCRSVAARSKRGIGGVEANVRAQRHVVLRHVARLEPVRRSAAAVPVPFRVNIRERPGRHEAEQDERDDRRDRQELRIPRGTGRRLARRTTPSTPPDDRQP